MYTARQHDIIVSDFEGGLMDTKYLSKNKVLLEKRYPFISAIFDNLSTSGTPGIEVKSSKSGLPTLTKAEDDGSRILFHSRYDPEKEAKDIVSRLNLTDSNLCVVFGFGLGYAAEILKSTVRSLVILIIEPDLSVFYAAAASRDLSELISSNRLHFFLGEDTEKFHSFCGTYLELSSIKNMAVLEHPPSLRFYPAFFEKAKDIIKGHIVQSAENLITLMEEGGGYQQNTLMSIREIVKSPGVSALFDKFENIPAVVVAAGPSLDKNVHLLVRNRDNVIIIAVDTAVNPLLKHGVKPHIVVTADPTFENYTHICDCSPGDFYLVAEPMTYPLALKQFADKLFIASFGDKMMHYLQKFIGEQGKLKVWGSVSSMAFDLAKSMGASPVIFIGQDFAFSGGRNYCSSTEHENVVLSSGSTDTRTVSEQTDIFGFPVMVEQQHQTYADYLSKEFRKTQCKIINATEGGILKEGVELMSLRDALFRFAQDGKEGENKKTVSEKLDEIYKMAYTPPPVSALSNGLKRVIRAMKRALKECERGGRCVSKIERTAKERLRSPEINRGLSSIQHHKDGITKEKEILPFLEMAGQKTLFAFKQGSRALEGRKADRDFLLEAAKLYGNLFAGTKEVIELMLPAFTGAYKDVDEMREKQ